MINRGTTKLLASMVALALGLTASPLLADHRKNHTGGGGTGGTVDGWYPWMSVDVSNAWSSGYNGLGTTITVVDKFSGSLLSRIWGNLGDGRQRLFHGEWTLKEAGMVARGATMEAFQYGPSSTVTIDLADVFNLSYGLEGDPQTETLSGVMAEFANDGALIEFARTGAAVVVHAAGNSSRAYGAPYSNPFGATVVDFVAQGLIEASAGNEAFSGLFVGALNKNGTFTDRAALASYSNFAGSDTNVQSRFLVVGVRDDLTGLRGTSFAAPIISGYAAIVSQKFELDTASPSSASLVSDRLLDTAISQDLNGARTLVDLGAAGWDSADAERYGQGEASLSRALSAAFVK